ncbi:Fic family protein [Seleniivibrio sp.]|uniref:Fic family protein n=1 Tax=Seleniivibrio sp. TaxID=2898801 RepID=UPI0025CEED9F|nr:Fic family protein [Seleniivibrio sp.]MCD8553104.1 Fic family protein [Seleniivibrio sp.]
MQNISDELLNPRLSLLNKLGSISSPVVTNNEWLYLLTEETRNSILIEGYFVDKKSLQDVFSNKKYKNNSDDVDKAVNYHQAANTFYGLAYNDYVDKTDSFLTPAIIKTINSTLRQGDNDTGFRRDHIVITGSKHTPPDYVDIEYLIKNHFLEHIIKSRKAYMAGGIKLSTYINSIAKLHCLFEAIHPFADGNGRTGRIFLNCMLIASGLPPVIIKGADNDRNKYYAALEEFDSKLGNSLNFRDSFYRIDNLINDEGNAELMTGIIYDSLLYSLDTFICNTLENRGVKISPIADIAPSMGYTADSLRVMVNRGQLIAKKAGKTWCSSEKLIIKNNMTEIESTI